MLVRDFRRSIPRKYLPILQYPGLMSLSSPSKRLTFSSSKYLYVYGLCRDGFNINVGTDGGTDSPSKKRTKGDKEGDKELLIRQRPKKAQTQPVDYSYLAKIELDTDKPSSCVSISPDGTLIACGGACLRVYDISHVPINIKNVSCDQSFKASSEYGMICDMSFTPDGRNIVAITTKAKIVVVSITSHDDGTMSSHIISCIDVHNDDSNDALVYVAVSRDAQWVAVSDFVGRVLVYELDSLIVCHIISYDA